MNAVDNKGDDLREIDVVSNLCQLLHLCVYFSCIDESSPTDSSLSIAPVSALGRIRRSLNREN